MEYRETHWIELQRKKQIITASNGIFLIDVAYKFKM